MRYLLRESIHIATSALDPSSPALPSLSWHSAAFFLSASIFATRSFASRSNDLLASALETEENEEAEARVNPIPNAETGRLAGADGATFAGAAATAIRASSSA